MIPEESIRAALERVLTSDNFINAERLSAFLRFTVERTLAGEGAQLKEYLLGTEVFGKGTDFDPRLDPVVRVEARRLRAKLQEYYEGAGRGDTIHILVRKGGYVPTFEQVARERPFGLARAGYPRWMWAAVVLLILVVGATLAVRQAEARRISMLVIPTVDTPEEQPFADGLGQALAGALSRNSRLRVVAWPKFADYRQSLSGPGKISIEKAAKDLGAETVLTVNVRQREGRKNIFAVLMKPTEGYKDWFHEYERGPGDEFASQRELAGSIAEEVRKKVGD